jgi:hypothetical protein
MVFLGQLLLFKLAELVLVAVCIWNCTIQWACVNFCLMEISGSLSAR